MISDNDHCSDGDMSDDDNGGVTEKIKMKAVVKRDFDESDDGNRYDDHSHHQLDIGSR